MLIYLHLKLKCMKPILIAGVTIVQLALISYAIAIILQSRIKTINKTVLTFLTLGVLLDITSTIFMILGAGKFISLHGFIGYSSLIGMVTDTIFSYRHVNKHGLNAPLSAQFLRGSIIAFAYWILAYITGAAIVMIGNV